MSTSVDTPLNNMDEIKKVFSIACDTYGLTPIQLWHINKGVSCMNDLVFSYKKESENDYIENYNILAKLLNSVQTVGNVFSLDDAGKVFTALRVIKAYIETHEMTEDVDTSYEFIKVVVNKCFFEKLIYSFAQIDRIVESIDSLTGMHLEKYKNVNRMETFAFIKEMIEVAQMKGKFTLEQANSILTIMSDVKKSVIKRNIEQKQAADAAAADAATAESVSGDNLGTNTVDVEKGNFDATGGKKRKPVKKN